MPVVPPPAPVPVPAVMPTPVMPVPAVVPAPVMVAPAMMAMPAHLGGQFGIILPRSGGAGVEQRQRRGALGRRCEDEHPADGEEAQNLFHVHVYPPSG